MASVAAIVGRPDVGGHQPAHPATGRVPYHVGGGRVPGPGCPGGRGFKLLPR